MGITSFNYSNYLYEFLADMVFPDTINEMNFTLKKEQMSLMPQLLVAIEKRIIEQKHYPFGKTGIRSRRQEISRKL
jgi:hypothetical protein